MVFKRSCCSVFFYVLIFAMLSPVLSFAGSKTLTHLKIDYPYNNTIFPIDIAAPTFKWQDKESVSKWRLEFDFVDGNPPLKILCDQNQWQPETRTWLDIKQRSLESVSVLTIYSLDSNSQKIGSVVNRRPVKSPPF